MNHTHTAHITTLSRATDTPPRNHIRTRRTSRLSTNTTPTTVSNNMEPNKVITSHTPNSTNRTPTHTSNPMHKCTGAKESTPRRKHQ